MSSTKPSFFYRNGLSIVVLAMMFISLSGQFVTGWKDNNSERADHNQPPLSVGQYFVSPQFVSATFENWESEFLQMAIYVVLTVKLRQKGSSESKKLKGEEGAEEEEADACDTTPKPESPWPVRRGGLWLKLYQNSLSIVLFLLFIISFCLHFAGSHAAYNDEQLQMGKPIEDGWQYIGNAHFWFESFQNWQSEFLSVASIVLLSIWLRQKGSPESKPVNASNDETGK
jgi:hypothetical protein